MRHRRKRDAPQMTCAHTWHWNSVRFCGIQGSSMRCQVTCPPTRRARHGFRCFTRDSKHSLDDKTRRGARCEAERGSIRSSRYVWDSRRDAIGNYRGGWAVQMDGGGPVVVRVPVQLRGPAGDLFGVSAAENGDAPERRAIGVRRVVVHVGVRGGGAVRRDGGRPLPPEIT